VYSGTCQVIHHTGFTLGYDKTFKQARWVVYGLAAAETNGIAARTDNFRPDPDVHEFSPKSEDYPGSGYDRGHLAPAADFKWSAQGMSETFLMSNMSPQKPEFNRGIWKKLEDQVRDWARENELIYVVTGPVFTENMQTIGAGRVAVPGLYFKVLLDYTEPELKAIGFLLPNQSSNMPLSGFVITVDSVEALTGLDFYSELPDDQEIRLESACDPNLWFDAGMGPAIQKPSGQQSQAAARFSADPCSQHCPDSMRTGAVCKDGTSSNARGRGACTGHGGVQCWKCGR
jgi:endonuclease G